MRYLLLKQFKSEKDTKISRGTSRTQDEDQNVIVKSKYFHNCTVKKTKRFRSAFTTEQINYLEEEFRKFPYIGSGNRKEVANKLNIPERAIKIWFQNRRMKEKKETVNKEFDAEAINQDATKYTNEPMKHWQSLNNHRSSIDSVKQKNICDTKYSVQPFDQAITVKNEQAVSSTNPIVKANEAISMKSFSKSAFAATKNSINAVPVVPQRVKNTSNKISEALPIQKNVCIKPSQNVIQSPPSYCPLTKTHLNIDQDMPQDLSSKTQINESYAQLPHNYPVNTLTGPGFVPIHMQTSHQFPPLQPGNVIWKPVNMLSTLPVPHSPAVSIGIPQNGVGMHGVNNNPQNNCNCNCHGSIVQCFNQVSARQHPQYIVAIPFMNPSK